MPVMGDAGGNVLDDPCAGVVGEGGRPDRRQGGEGEMVEGDRDLRIDPAIGAVGSAMRQQGGSGGAAQARQHETQALQDRMVRRAGRDQDGAVTGTGLPGSCAVPGPASSVRCIW